MKWLKKVTLETDHIRLVPLNENHEDALLLAAGDGNLWDLWYTSVPSSESVHQYVEKALKDFESDKGLAFVVFDRKSDQIIGSTRYTNATPEHRRLEIGFTWYAKSYQKTYVNSECKLLLLRHAFEELKAIAVEFRTNWYNFQSRKAILSLGAKQDGVLRNHQIMPNGSLRDTVVFSILASEWDACKYSLEHRVRKIHSYSNHENQSFPKSS